MITNNKIANKNKLAGLKIDLKYALIKAKEYGNVPYGGTKKTRKYFEMWEEEVKRLRKEINAIKSEIQKGSDKK